MKITTGKYELVHSGTLIQIENEPLNILLPDNIEGDYTIVLEFLEVPNEKTITKTEAIHKFKFRIQFVNFDGRQNIGNSEPLHLGTLGHKNLYLIYRINDLASVSKMIHYNFYVEGSDANG